MFNNKSKRRWLLGVVATCSFVLGYLQYGFLKPLTFFQQWSNVMITYVKVTEKKKPTINS